MGTSIQEQTAKTILELIDCLGSLDLHPADRRVERLLTLYRELTGEAPS